uniref:Uncharacterized protein n=1 Tax=Arundo donax TaxID=35708 RepID=A0A0A9BXT2_ARUDO
MVLFGWLGLGVGSVVACRTFSRIFNEWNWANPLFHKRELLALDFSKLYFLTWCACIV